jgi:predicted ATPase
VLNHNLPAPTTPFVGRNREIADVKRLLDTSRLLTLTGVGGTGKTRLALRVVWEVADYFANGVYFVDLAPLSDHTLVAYAIAAALGSIEHPAEPLVNTLKRALGEREVLLLIDNFEHVVEAAPLLSELLAAAPRLKMLVTSRERLHVSGEQEYDLHPLSLPSVDAASVQNLTQSEAGTLFVQRAQMTLPGFRVRDDNAPPIACICNRLDVPSRPNWRRCKRHARRCWRLDSRLDAPTGGVRDARQPACAARLMELTAEYREQTLFARLAFQAALQQTAEAVCGDGPLTIRRTRVAGGQEPCAAERKHSGIAPDAGSDSRATR